MTKKDVKLIIILVLISIIMYAGYKFYINQQDNGDIEIVFHDEVVYTMSFSEDEIYEIDGDYGHMVIEVKDEKVYVKEVECPNHTCEYTGKVGKGSMIPICCLPNDIIIYEVAK